MTFQLLLPKTWFPRVGYSATLLGKYNCWHAHSNPQLVKNPWNRFEVPSQIHVCQRCEQQEQKRLLKVTGRKVRSNPSLLRSTRMPLASCYWSLRFEKPRDSASCWSDRKSWQFPYIVRQKQNLWPCVCQMHVYETRSTYSTFCETFFWCGCSAMFIFPSWMHRSFQ